MSKALDLSDDLFSRALVECKLEAQKACEQAVIASARMQSTLSNAQRLENPDAVRRAIREAIDYANDLVSALRDAETTADRILSEAHADNQSEAL